MYNPALHAETRLDVLHALMRAHPLGTWVVADGTQLVVNHIPFLLDAARGEHGVLMGHVARANPIWQAPAGPVPCVVAFQGPQTYITPAWYPSKHQHGKAVPTWNYAVVHAHGTPRFIEDRAWLHMHVGQLADTHEANRAVPWKLTDAPADYVQKMLDAIVGVEIPIERIEGKWKTSQNRTQPDRLGVVAGLLGQGTEAAANMAALVRQHAGPDTPSA